MSLPAHAPAVTDPPDARPPAILLLVPGSIDEQQATAWATDVIASLVSEDLLPGSAPAVAVAGEVLLAYAAVARESEGFLLAGLWNDQFVPVVVDVAEAGSTASSPLPISTDHLLGCDHRTFEANGRPGVQDVCFAYLDDDLVPAETGELWAFVRIAVRHQANGDDIDVLAVISSPQLQAVMAILESVQAYLTGSDIGEMLSSR